MGLKCFTIRCEESSLEIVSRDYKVHSCVDKKKSSLCGVTIVFTILSFSSQEPRKGSFPSTLHLLEIT